MRRQHLVHTAIRWFAVCLMMALGVGVAAAGGYDNPHLLVEPSWLAEHLADDNVRVIDVRGDLLYTRGHIPGAVSLDGTSQLNDPDKGVAGFLVGPEAFEQLAQDLGINDDTTVVIYDQSSSLSASRLFYAFEYYGHKDRVRLLNGGFAAWVAEQKPLETGTNSVVAGNFTAQTDAALFASADYVAQQIGKDDVVILDVRSEGEFLGTDVRAASGGHIPGAVHVEWSTAVETGTVQRFKSADALIDLYNAAGVDPSAEVIPYCQTNVRGAHTYFVLRLLGFENIRPYEGSWAEWGNRTDVPIAAGR